MTTKSLAYLAGALALMFSSTVNAQFNGRAGDVVIYAVTANGSGDVQAQPLTATNTAAGASAFHTTRLSTVPIQLSDPFPLRRQVLYEQPNELFQVSTDAEGNIGLHRVFLVPTKLYSISGIIDPIPPGPGSFGFANTFIAFPQNLDVDLDLVLDKLQFINWAPRAWPFLQVVTQRGSVGPPNISGWQYLFSLPNAVLLPGVIPWANMSALYPADGWKPGFDLKMLEIDPKLGSTIRLLRLRPGAKTQNFRIPGHTHLFVVQGSVSLTPAGGSTSVMLQNDYAYVPENFAISLANPIAYQGPTTK